MIGALRDRIEILAASRHDDGAGGASLEWSPAGSGWASVERLSSVRDVSGEGRRRLRRIAVRIRPRPEITLGRRIRFDGADYEIVSMEDVGARDRILLVCEEIAA